MNNMPTRVKRRFLLKIDLPALLAFILFAGMIFLYLIPAFERVMMDRKRNLIHEMTSSVYSLLEHYHTMETDGAPRQPYRKGRSEVSHKCHQVRRRSEGLFLDHRYVSANDSPSLQA